MAEKANEVLLYAAINGSVEGTEAALKAGADIDFKHAEKGNPGTALYVASNAGHVDVVRLLLRKGASVAERTGSMTPLHVAAHIGSTEIVDLLVQHGATVDVRDGWQFTPLQYACNYKNVDTVRRLIELGARPDFVDEYAVAHILRKYGGNIDNDEGFKLIQEARKTKLLRCCNPKCGKPGYRSTGTLKLCGRCKLTRYCSRDCQKQHWSVGHKKCCGHDAFTGKRAEFFQHWADSLADHVQEHGLFSSVQHLERSLTTYVNL
ncbi:poly [ADP-ribose] polymerase tankyrase-2-like isoform X4 [Branchiostoma floridae]|uniref:Poly [ADP-ribose] polymerase tankyrase-2-like isoform X4 n=1 Tax=Branchiostoma floridae TaxID=7739 RepID=A0A9J7HUH2_BRAFL|nr:poly [ADP-ribose] polymerase tankyrase-2-like isoform X4 [Branchiostoma floridae]